MKPATTASAWATASPLARGMHVDLTETIEPVWFVLVRARREDGTFGLVGSIWVAEDDGDGGFLSIAAGGWMADEMRRSYDSALANAAGILDGSSATGATPRSTTRGSSSTPRSAWARCPSSVVRSIAPEEAGRAERARPEPVRPNAPSGTPPTPPA